ncbi:MAG TPA: DUF4932 domain-containing protein [Alphaproteobacteria bacterium]|nr:DUF4932 domain-containing protein [Alphaproteobacteria bacterium]
MTKAQLEVSETLFSAAVALNGCGYDAGIDASLPLRQTVRAEIQSLRKTEEGAKALAAICQFWIDHRTADSSLNVSRYISLALNLTPPPFKTAVPESDLPPDASEVLGFVPLLQKFYDACSLHTLWAKHQGEYEALIRDFHEQVSDVISRTDLYLRLPFSSSLGRRFVIYLEPLFAPGQVNSRNYGEAYFLVIAPGRKDAAEPVRIQEIRHTYLHYVLEPLNLGRSRSLKRLEPLLPDVAAAPMDQAFKNDIGLLVTECLIRAIEIRMSIAKGNEAARIAAVQHSAAEGFVLTRYFYDTLGQFEKESIGVRNAYGDFLYNIDLGKEKKRASEIVFAAYAEPEVVAKSRPRSRGDSMLDAAEQQLVDGDPAGAEKLVTAILSDPQSHADQSRAYFILARTALMSKNLEGAQLNFERAIQAAHDDPRTLAWSHIYLGRIFDIQDQRDAAVAHYRAALNAGDPTPDTRAAAERGLAAAYRPPSPR